MVDVGTLTLRGTLDIRDIERGQRRITVGFDNIKSSADSTFSSFRNISSISGSLINSFSNLATLGGGFLATLAAGAPQTAASLASIGVDTKRLALIAGDELSPAFEKVSSSYSEFVNFLEGGSPLSEIVKDVGKLVGTAGIASVGAKLLGLKNIGKIIIPISLLVGLNNQREAIEREVESQTGSALAGQLAGGALTAGTTAAGAGVSVNLLSRIPGLSRFIPSVGTAAAAGAGISALDDLSFSQNPIFADAALFGGAGGVGGFALGGPVGGAIGAGGGALIGGAFGGGRLVFRQVRDIFYETDTQGGN